MLRNKNDITKRVNDIIDGFAHREVIREDDRRAWVRDVVGRFGEEAVWHAARAGGFGGSEAGVLVRNFLGHRADHQASAREIVAGKLLRALPGEETGDLRRGHKFEPVVAEFFYEKHGARRHQAYFDRLRESTGVRPWMRYSPDELATLPGKEGEAPLVVLADYKCPRTVDPMESISFQYSCQLHQGAMICHKAGITLDLLALVQFDWAQCDIKVDYVPYDPDLARLIVQAGDHYWGYVLKGELPDYIFTPRFKDAEGFVKAHSSLAQRYATVAAMASALDARREALATELKAHLDGFRLENSKIDFGVLKVSAASIMDKSKVDALVADRKLRGRLAKKGGKKVVDVEGALAELQQRGCDTEQFVSREIDPLKLYEHMQANEMDPEAVMTEQIRFTVSADIKAEAAKTVEMVWGDQSNSEAESTASSKPAAEAEAECEAFGDESAGDEETVREGQSTERLAPRTHMA
jgi:hypothetical protein